MWKFFSKKESYSSVNGTDALHGRPGRAFLAVHTAENLEFRWTTHGDITEMCYMVLVKIEKRLMLSFMDLL